MASLLALDPYVTDWLNLLTRWLHVIAGIVWIGSSFYFIALDNHLRPPRDEREREAGIGGETWEIHGGGFYNIKKYLVAPRVLPETLHWFKWEAYTTWLSGFALMIVLYYLNADTYLIDKSVADLSTGEAVAISIGLLAAAWLVYDVLCRLLASRPLVLAAVLLGSITLAAWGIGQLFSARAMYLQIGAMLGTIMVGNVFFVIIPAHWELVRAKQAGRDPDPAANARGKAAVRAQQLPDAAGRLHDALEPLSLHLRAQLLLADPRRAARHRRVGPPLLQPAPHGSNRVGDSGDCGARDRRARDPDPAPDRVRRGNAVRSVHASRADRRAALRRLPLPKPHEGRRGAARDQARHAARRSRLRRQRSSSRPCRLRRCRSGTSPA